MYSSTSSNNFPLLINMQGKANAIHFPCKKKMATEDSDRDTADPTLSFLDLPDLVLECILRKLPPSSLLTMSHVCKSLRRSCTSDHMWGSHLERKWGKLLGPAAERERRRIYLGLKVDGHRKSKGEFRGGKQKGPMMVLTRAVWFCLWVRRGDLIGNRGAAEQRCCSLADDSAVYWYFALENGRFWFPAQVYNRENGDAGCILSCYDAEICYNSQTNTFKARYPPHGSRAMTLETGVRWERVRPPPTEISNLPHDVHWSDCLKDLRPGDSVEIQWRLKKEFPYGWWYGVIGHLESCVRESPHLCRCHDTDDVVLEFTQFSPDSPWSRAKINRRSHGEEGNEAYGFYGGIRKLKKEEEISAWKKLWPDELL